MLRQKELLVIIKADQRIQFKNMSLLTYALLNIKGALVIQSLELNNILLFLTFMCVEM